MRYVAIFEEDSRGWRVRVPRAPGGQPCEARGATVGEARDQIRRAVGARLEGGLAHRVALIESFVGEQ